LTHIGSTADSPAQNRGYRTVQLFQISAGSRASCRRGGLGEIEEERHLDIVREAVERTFHETQDV